MAVHPTTTSHLKHRRRLTRARGRWRAAWPTIGLAAAWILPAGQVDAQATTPVPSDLACPTCTIRVDAVVTIGRDDDRLGSRPYAVRRDSRGRYHMVAPESNPSVPLVFSARGGFLRELGREGAGPGEFRDAIALEITRGDTIHVFDRGNARLSVLDPGMREVRTSPIPPSTNTAIVLPTGTVVVNAAVGEPDRIGHPFHRLDQDGNYTGYFGADAGSPVQPGDIAGTVRWMTPALGNKFWSLNYARSYTLELWDADGTLLKRITRDADWFAPYDRATSLAPRNPPQSRGMGVWYDQRVGLLWTIMHVADPRWRDGTGPLRRAHGEEYLPIHDMQRVYDTIVEVIDVNTNRVLARRRFDMTIDLPIGAGLFAGARETPEGAPYLDVWRFSLVER